MTDSVMQIPPDAASTGWHRGALGRDTAMAWPRIFLWLAFVFALLDVTHPIEALTDSWWLFYVPLWLISPHLVGDRPFDARKAVKWLALGFTFSWLIYRTMTATLIPISHWTLGLSDPKLNLLSFPAQLLVAATATAALVGMPIARCFGKYALALAVVATLPVSLQLGGTEVWEDFPWTDRPLRSSLSLFDTFMPLLIVAEGVAIAQSRIRSRNEFPRPRSGLLVHRWLSTPVGRGLAVLVLLASFTLAMWGHWLVPDDMKNAGPSVILGVALMFPVAAAVLALAVVLIWQQLATSWRCAGGSRRILPALGMAVIGVMAFVVSARLVLAEAPLTGALLSEAVHIAAGRTWEIEIINDLTEIHLSGELQRGVAKRLTSELVQTPGIERVVLTSPGGSIPAGFALAQVIQEHGLSTFVRGECSSACTIAFVAGSHRELSPDGRLGFHGYKLATWFDTVDGIIEYFVERGLDREFVERGFEIPHEEMWYPQREELVLAGVFQNRGE